MKRTLSISALVAILIASVAFSITSSQAASSGGSAGSASNCKFKKSAIPSSAIKFSSFYARFHKPTSVAKASDKIKASQAYAILFYSWRSFGYSINQSSINARKNLRQAKSESGLRPNAIQSQIDVNSGGNEAGGLFQLIPATFDTWKVRGFNNRFNLLDNSLAVVNAQINADTIYTSGALDGKGTRKIKVLNGQGGWRPSGGANACR